MAGEIERKKKVARVLSWVGLCGWVFAGTFRAYLQCTRPSIPDPTAFRTILEFEHGHRFYVSSWEHITFYGLLIVSGLLAFTGICISMRLERSKAK